MKDSEKRGKITFQSQLPRTFPTFHEG